MDVFTIPHALAKNDDLVVLPRKHYERVLRMAQGGQTIDRKLEAELESRFREAQVLKRRGKLPLLRSLKDLRSWIFTIIRNLVGCTRSFPLFCKSWPKSGSACLEEIHSIRARTHTQDPWSTERFLEFWDWRKKSHHVWIRRAGCHFSQNR